MARKARDIIGSTYALTNHTTDIDIDCNSATNDELSDLIGTVIRDLIRKGILEGTVSSGA